MILHVPAFPTNPSGHGGNQRSAQVSEFLSTVHQTTSIAPQSRKRAVPSAKLLLRAFQIGLSFPSYATSLGRLLLHNIEIDDDAIVATEQYYWSVPAYLRFASEFRTIVFPQNIESQVPEQSRSLHRKQAHDFELECKLLSIANCCVCISEEDCNAVRPFVKTVFNLPYFPCRQRFEQLLEVRRERLQTRKRNIVLVLGSATNPPTRLGMEELLATVDAQAVKEMHGLQVVVAGHGTECLKQYQRAGVAVEGSVSGERLRELQRHAHCQLINHVRTSGALTRVVEAVCCGIPVIGNTYASRGYKDLNGLTVVNSTTEIWRHALELPLHQIPPIPQPPRAEETNLRNFLQQTYGLSGSSYEN